jgi:hypothetical protein
MALNFPVPTKAKFAPTVNNFSAAFTGIYDFNIPANDKQVLFKMQPNTVYFIDNFSFAGNIPREDFLDALLLAEPPRITIKRISDGQTVYDNPIFLTQFYEDKPATTFLSTRQQGDAALITLNAQLSQTANLIGKSPIVLTIAFNMFYIDDNKYAAAYLDALDASYSRRLLQ